MLLTRLDRKEAGTGLPVFPNWWRGTGSFIYTALLYRACTGITDLAFGDSQSLSVPSAPNLKFPSFVRVLVNTFNQIRCFFCEVALFVCDRLCGRGEIDVIFVRRMIHVL